MGLGLASALRLFGTTADPAAAGSNHSIAFVGSGGKTTAMLRLAEESPVPVIVTSTTHLGAWQIQQVGKHVVAESENDVGLLGREQITVVTGSLQPDDRTEPVNAAVLEALHERTQKTGWLLLIEADGARGRPLKAPGPHEPPIPGFIGMVVVVSGLGGLSQRLSESYVHRPELFGRITGLAPGATITPEALGRALTSMEGGLKNIPSGARRVALLNQADTVERQAVGSQLSPSLLTAYDAVLVASLRDGILHAIHEACAGIVLAAGASRRFGAPKQLLLWKGEPFVRAVASTALNAHLEPVIVVTGSEAAAVEAAVVDLPVRIVRNAAWQEGQASSIRAGVEACPSRSGAAVFLLADQPQVTTEVIHALVDAHAAGLPPIVAPLILEERRGNPVLFDRSTFSDLLSLKGDVGGRELFSRHRVTYLPWHDRGLLTDVDTPEDYAGLSGGDS